MKLAMMQKTPIFTTFSAHTKMAADKRGQIEAFGRNYTIALAYCRLLHQSFDGQTPCTPWHGPVEALASGSLLEDSEVHQCALFF